MRLDFFCFFQRSASSHRSIVKRAAVSPGIALSAPAILSKHEYMETLLIKQVEPRATSAHRIEKSPKKVHLPKKRRLKTERFRLSTSSEEIELSSTKLKKNLPEFIHFKSDHLVLTPQLISPPSSDRLRSLSASQTSKLNRASQSTAITTNQSIKRISRSRHSYDSVVYHEKQQKKYSSRPMPNKFDSMSCFNEVSGLEIFFFFFFFLVILFIRPHDILHRLKEIRCDDEHESIHRY